MKVPFFDLTAMHAEISVELDEAWQQVCRSTGFIGGHFVEQLEAEWAEYCGALYCVGLSSGTAALQLALAGLGIGPGDEVIVPANSFVATAEAVMAVGAKPVFVDVDASTLLMTAATVEPAITPHTAAIIVVHLYGQPVDMDAMRRVASVAGLALLEDAAQAHGATWNGRRVGTLADVGCFSFYPGKNLGAFGDGGAIVTADRGLADRIRSLSNHGRVRGNHQRHELPGGNHRLDALQAAILSVKLKRLDAWNAGRGRAASSYKVALANAPIEPVSTAPGARSNNHLFVVQTRHRDKLRSILAQEGIGTGVHYLIPCHLQPAFASTKITCLPVVQRAAERVLSLPMFPHLNDADIEHVANTIRRALIDLETNQGLGS